MGLRPDPPGGILPPTPLGRGGTPRLGRDARRVYTPGMDPRSAGTTGGRTHPLLGGGITHMGAPSDWGLGEPPAMRTILAARGQPLSTGR